MRSIARDALFIAIAVWLFIAATTTGYAARPSTPTLALRGVCEPTAETWRMELDLSRSGRIELAWGNGGYFGVVYRGPFPAGRTTFDVGQKPPGTVTLLARYVAYPQVSTEAEVNEVPC